MGSWAGLVIEIVERGGCSAIFHAISEDDLVRIMKHPATMIASGARGATWWRSEIASGRSASVRRVFIARYSRTERARAWGRMRQRSSRLKFSARSRALNFPSPRYTASAPASSAARANDATSVTFGVSFGMIGSGVRAAAAGALRIALQDDYFVNRKLYPNVDFYSGLIYQAMGFPVDMFPVLFAIPRTSGWLAQWEEMIEDKDQKIARPRQIYIGSDTRDYVSLNRRS